MKWVPLAACAILLAQATMAQGLVWDDSAPASTPAAPMVPPPANSATPVQTAPSSSLPTVIPAVMTTASAPLRIGRSSDAAKVAGMGVNIPLKSAIRRIVPPSMSISIDGDIDAGTRVSWQGERTWQAVLTELLLPLGLRHESAGNSVRIARVRPATSSGTAPVASSSEPVKMRQDSPPPTTEPGTTVVQDRMWTVRRGDTLVATLANWARQAGYQDPVNYLRGDIQFDAGADFEGNFESAVENLGAAIADRPSPPLITISRRFKTITITSSQEDTGGS